MAALSCGALSTHAAETSRISLGPHVAQGDGNSFDAAISADGRFVAFSSEASNLVPGDTNGVSDIFVYDRQTATTTRISLGSHGTPGNGSSFEPAISGGGRYVAFASEASNLVPDDTNGSFDVFIRDRWTATTTRVSLGANGAQSDGSSWEPAISAHGRYVAFASDASNLVPNDTNGASDIFVHDRRVATTTRASLGAQGTQSNAESFGLSISSGGRYVAFSSEASNLVPGDTNGASDIFVHDRQTAMTTRASLGANGVQTNGRSTEPAISPGGRYVAFSSGATNLVSGDTNGLFDIFVRDLRTATTMRVSLGTDGNQGNDLSSEPAISAYGRYVAFSSDATNLVLGDTNASSDVFVRSR
jgi:Tol biopolymer transport system component